MTRAEKLLIGIGVAALLVYLLCFARTDWLVFQELGRLEAVADGSARQFLVERGAKLEGLQPIRRFENQGQAADSLRTVLDPQEALRVFEEEVTPLELTTGWGGTREDGHVNDVHDRETTVTLDARGRLIGFRIRPEDAPSPTGEAGNVAETARAFLTQSLGVAAADVSAAPEIGHTVQAGVGIETVKWELKDRPAPGATLTHRVELRGTAPISYSREVVFSKVVQAEVKARRDLARYLPSGGVFLVILLSFFVFVGRVRREEIDFRLGGIAGLVMMGAFGTGQGLLFSVQPGMEGATWLFVALINAVVFGLLAVLVYAAGESLARETWPQKLEALNQLLAGNLLSRPIGRSILIGWSFGVLSLAVQQTVVAFVFPAILGLCFADGIVLAALMTPIPALCLLGLNLMGVLLLEGTGRLFLLSWLRPRVRRTVVLIAIGVLLNFGLAYQGLEGIRPISVGLIFAMLLTLASIGAFLTSEFLASLVCFTVIGILPAALSLVALGGAHAAGGAGLALLLVAMLIVGIVAFLRPKPIQERGYVPNYVSRLRERERQHHELALARTAQQNILPRHIPLMLGFDIATVCVPAMEVGGDYYDFFPLGPRRLGVVIGDVSGKGIRAAFYMTLAKGILISSVTPERSPREVLSRLNELFYQQVERGVFLSVAYGVFDLDRKTLTVARAGHNPLISIRGGAGEYSEIESEGIAVGLDRGERFDAALEERTVPLHEGDVFIFYTDGFTEAMNANREEFGEERMCKVLTGQTSADAEALLAGLNQAVREFVADTPQHDDMTMVLVRVVNDGTGPPP